MIWKKTLIPVWPVLVIVLMACLSLKCVKVKPPRFLSTIAFFLSMLMGDWRSPPQWDWGRRCHFEGLYTVGREDIKTWPSPVLIALKCPVIWFVYTYHTFHELHSTMELKEKQNPNSLFIYYIVTCFIIKSMCDFPTHRVEIKEGKQILGVY